MIAKVSWKQEISGAFGELLKRPSCALGNVRVMVGHLEGMVGSSPYALIRVREHWLTVVLMLRELTRREPRDENCPRRKSAK
jgi:hypothetical protein